LHHSTKTEATQSTVFLCVYLYVWGGPYLCQFCMYSAEIVSVTQQAH